MPKCCLHDGIQKTFYLILKKEALVLMCNTNGLDTSTLCEEVFARQKYPTNVSFPVGILSTARVISANALVSSPRK